MSWIRNIFLKNSKNQQIDPVTDESLMILRELLINIESLGSRDRYGRLKVVWEDFLQNSSIVQASGSGIQTKGLNISNGGGASIAITTSASSVVANLGGNAAQVGLDASFNVYDIMNYSYGCGVAKNLTRT